MPTPAPSDPPAAPPLADAVVQGLAAEILAHLEQHPHKADSALHIARWWLPQSRVEAALDQVQRALDLLRDSGAIELCNGGIYRLPRGGESGQS